MSNATAKGRCAGKADHGPAVRNPLCCIVPDFVQTNIVENLRPDRLANTQYANIDHFALRKTVLDSLNIDSTFRLVRVGQAEANRAARARLRARLRSRLRAAAPPTSPPGVPDRVIYTAENTYRPQQVVRQEGDPASTDVAVNEAYDYLGATYDFYYQIFDRNSIDNQGMELDGVVHLGKNYDNAFWNGQQMVFGDGDQVVFNRFTIAPDVIGHELTHGVTEHEAGLIYFGQPGAMNESFSDVMGSLVMQYLYNQDVSSATWLIGAQLVIPLQSTDPNVYRKALRSMKEPGTAYKNDPVLGTDPQPGHMSQYVVTLQDNGGVHINSGIPNRAFYEVANVIGGYAWEKAGLIWYDTMADPRLQKVANFQDFARLTALIAKDLFGANSTEYNAVRRGWSAVGIGV